MSFHILLLVWCILNSWTDKQFDMVNNIWMKYIMTKLHAIVQMFGDRCRNLLLDWPDICTNIDDKDTDEF